MDNHATTPVDPRVVEAICTYFTEKFGNAASRNHSFGWAGEEAVETSRQQIASLINATAKEIIFTSGATESTTYDQGHRGNVPRKGNHISLKHRAQAVLDTCKNLEKHGFEVTYLPVQRDGRVSLEIWRPRLAFNDSDHHHVRQQRNRRAQPIAEIGKIAKEHGIFFAVDGVQAVGKIPVDVQKDTSTCCHQRPTRFTVRRVLALCTFAGAIPACSFPPLLTAAVTSAACVPAR